MRRKSDVTANFAIDMTDYKNVTAPIKQPSLFKHVFIFGFNISLIILVGFSRVVLGQHAINQVMLGWACGIFAIFLYNRYLDNYIEDALHELLEVHRYSRLSYLFSYFISLLILFLIPFFMFAFNLEYRFQKRIKWEVALGDLVDLCGPFSKQDSFEYKTLMDTCSVLGATGSVAGILASTKWYTMYLSENPKAIRIGNNLKRLLMSGLLCGSAFYFFTNLIPRIAGDYEIVVELLVRKFIAAFVPSFIFTGILPLIFRYVGL